MSKVTGNYENAWQAKHLKNQEPRKLQYIRRFDERETSTSFIFVRLTKLDGIRGGAGKGPLS